MSQLVSIAWILIYKFFYCNLLHAPAYIRHYLDIIGFYCKIVCMTNQLIAGETESSQPQFSIKSVVENCGISNTAAVSELKGPLRQAIEDKFIKAGLNPGPAREKATRIVSRIPTITPQTAEKLVREVITRQQRVAAVHEAVTANIARLPQVSAANRHRQMVEDTLNVSTGDLRSIPCGHDASIVAGPSIFSSWIVHSESNDDRGSSATYTRDALGEESSADAYWYGSNGYSVTRLSDTVDTPWAEAGWQSFEAGEESHPISALFAVVKSTAEAMMTGREQIGMASTGPEVRKLVAGAGLELIHRVFEVAHLDNLQQDPGKRSRRWQNNGVTGDQVERACAQVIRASTPVLTLPVDPVQTLPLRPATEVYMAASLSLALGKLGELIARFPKEVAAGITASLTTEMPPVSVEELDQNNLPILSEILKRMDPRDPAPIQDFTNALGLPPVGQRCEITYDYGHMGDPEHESYRRPLELVVVADEKIRHIEEVESEPCGY